MLQSLSLLKRQLPQRFLLKPLFSSAPKTLTFATKNTKSPPSTEDEITNEPIKFFGSQAATWRAKDTRSGGSDQSLWYQPYVISGSLAIFLLYFCILREESDIDQRLEGNLFDQVSGLEQVQLTVNYKYNKENNLDTREIERRLVELGIDVQQLELQRRLEMAQ